MSKTNSTITTHDDQTDLGVPAAGKAWLGDLANLGELIDCPVIRPVIWNHGIEYHYVGCSYGHAIYKTRHELAALDHELTADPTAVDPTTGPTLDPDPLDPPTTDADP